MFREMNLSALYDHRLVVFGLKSGAVIIVITLLSIAILLGFVWNA